VSSSESDVLMAVPPYCCSAAIALSGVACSITMNSANLPGCRLSRTCCWKALSIPYSPMWPNSAPMPADRQSSEWDEEQQPEQEAPEATPPGAGAR